MIIHPISFLGLIIYKDDYDNWLEHLAPLFLGNIKSFIHTCCLTLKSQCKSDKYPLFYNI